MYVCSDADSCKAEGLEITFLSLKTSYKGFKKENAPSGKSINLVGKHDQADFAASDPVRGQLMTAHEVNTPAV